MIPGSDPRRRHSELEITTPLSSWNHLPENGLDPEMLNQGHRDGDALDVVRLARRTSGSSRPPRNHPKASKALRPLLILCASSVRRDE